MDPTRRHRSTFLSPFLVAAVVGACAAPAATPTPPASMLVTPTATPAPAATSTPTAVQTPTPAPAGTPAPVAPAFGPATNGALYYATGGEVFRLDSPTATPRSILDGYDLVLPSKDGSKLALGTSSPSGLTLSVADADGNDVRRLTGVYNAQDFEIDWAPSGDALAIVSPTKGRRELTVIPTDGAAPTTASLEIEPDNLWYLPDGRILFQGAAADAGGEPTFGIYTVAPMSFQAEIVSAPPASDRRITEPAPSPDGKTIVYHAVDGPYEHGRLRLMDIDGTHDRALGVEEPNEEFADQSATFSPDGKQVLFTRFTAPGTTLTLTSADGGPARAIGEMLPGNDMAVAAFSPDGTKVIAYYPPTGHLWLLDATGSGTDEQLQLPVRDMPTWQRIGA